MPTDLIKTALTELLERGERDHRLRQGLQKIFITVAGREPSPQALAATAKIMGVINARGYRPAFRKRSAGYDPEVLLRTVQKLPHDTTVTLSHLLNANN